ncbi:MAG TPA: hypothetical protein VGM79_03420 [Streptosporangiaceae bacterium]|jgi:hypothetical protein
MALFGHRENLRRLQESGVPGLSDIAVRQGWEPAPGAPFAGLLEADIREISLAVYQAPPGLAIPGGQAGAGPIAYSDAYRGALDGRMVLVANAWTSIAGTLRGMAVCAAELPAALTLVSVQPRRFAAALALPEIATGHPAFDGRFLVQATADLDGPVLDVLTRDAQQRMLARDDWFFRAGRGLLGCVTPEPFRAVDEVSTRIGEVLAIAAAIPARGGRAAGAPAPPIMPAPVSYDPVSHEPGGLSPGGVSPAELLARLGQLASLDDALGMLAALTPAERDLLAGLDTPLASLAGARTPQEATARYRTLDPQAKLRLAAMFMRRGGPARRSASRLSR